MLAPLRFLSQYSTVNAKLNIETFPDPALRVNPHAPPRQGDGSFRRQSGCVCPGKGLAERAKGR